MVDKLYRNYRIRPEYKKSFDAAARALLDAFVQQNWSDSFGHYTNQYCTIEDDSRMKPWRGLYEIAWTGGVIQGYPFLRANDLLRLATDFFDGCKDGMTLLNEVAKSLNPKSGLFYDLTRPLEGSRVNGWWSPMKVTWDCHAAYTNGQALYYLFLAMDHCQKKRIAIPELWEKNAQIVADRLVALQRDDGCCGYAYYSDRAEVSDWDGFAGCWVAAAFAAAYRYTKKEEYGEAASKGMHYYRDDILACQANGTPMDTWKSPDEEGNIAFIKGARLMHMISGDPQYLEMLEEGAQYEYLWRYGFKGHPEFAPLKGSGYNSCGGSITSVSNPHQHPMGLLVTEDLYYLADHTDQEVHRHRADDGIAWAMQCLELYPKISGYGQYGVVTERFCPSDGLTIESYPDGNPASMWFSYNGWAAANILEAILSVIEYQSQDKKKSGGQ
jgi:hypothetical protein